MNFTTTDPPDPAWDQARRHIENLATKGISARWNDLAKWQRDHHVLVERGAHRIVKEWHGSVPVIEDALVILGRDPVGNRREIETYTRALQICEGIE
jgi:hypothetical protein